MVKRTLCALVALTGCGPGLTNGTYPGEARFVVAGTVLALSPVSASGSLQVTVRWSIVPAPPPASGAQSATAAAPASGVATAPGVPTTPATPPPVVIPTTVSTSDPSVNAVAFPAPVSLSLYDIPSLAGQPASQAEGEIIVFADQDGDHLYTAGVDTILGSGPTDRLLYSASASLAAPPDFVAALLDNPQALQAGFSQAQSSCNDGREHLSISTPHTVTIAAGPPPTCP